MLVELVSKDWVDETRAMWPKKHALFRLSRDEIMNDAGHRLASSTRELEVCQRDDISRAHRLRFLRGFPLVSSLQPPTTRRRRKETTSKDRAGERYGDDAVFVGSQIELVSSSHTSVGSSSYLSPTALKFFLPNEREDYYNFSPGLFEHCLNFSSYS